MEPDLARIMEDLPQALVDGLDGLTVEGVKGRVTLHHRHAGDLIVTSGAIVACDPKWIEENTIWPFVTRLLPGRYPVILSIAHFRNGDQRVAYAVLRVREQSPVRWVVALFPKEAMRNAEDDNALPGYGVDSGEGCFMDADAARVWAPRINTIADADQVIDDDMDRNGSDTAEWANISLEPDVAANLIAFSTGFGDGVYASYFGYDVDDVIVCLVTDFALFWRDN